MYICVCVCVCVYVYIYNQIETQYFYFVKETDQLSIQCLQSYHKHCSYVKCMLVLSKNVWHLNNFVTCNNLLIIYIPTCIIIGLYLISIYCWKLQLYTFHLAYIYKCLFHSG